MRIAGLILSIFALLLNVIPYILFLMEPHILVLLLLSAFPFMGIIIGIITVCLGEKRIGRPAMVMSAIVLAWPVVFVTTVILMTNTGVMRMNMM